MVEIPKYEIPEAVREMAERNIDQARQAYNKFLDMARQAQQQLTHSTDALSANALQLQSRAAKFAEDNINASFDFAAELARARDLKEYLEIQTKHAQAQMKTFANQTQELGRLMAEAAQKATKG
jgi:phasin